MQALIMFGYGYVARHLATHYKPSMPCWGTVRGEDKARRMQGEPVEPLVFDGKAISPALENALAEATHILISAPPGEGGDPVLTRCREALAASGRLQWIGYYSTLAVYGDHQGAWIDEETALQPTTARGRYRQEAEEGWLALGEETGASVAIFRLPGIYGPGRNAFASLQAGKMQRILKEGQVFNRVHVDDIARATAKAMRDGQGGVFNITDDLPAASSEVIAYAAGKLGLILPPPVQLEDAGLSPMAKGFYSENKRASNSRMKDVLGITPRYPTYKEGLDALFAAGEGQTS